jgi:hypothetical protein
VKPDREAPAVKAGFFLTKNSESRGKKSLDFGPGLYETETIVL